MVASPRPVQEFNHRIHVIRPVEVLVPFPTSQTIQQPASATAAGLRLGFRGAFQGDVGVVPANCRLSAWRA